MISHFFIRRPVFATVVSIIMTLAGLAAMFVLPVEQYPEISPPTVQVSAFYPGADSDTVQSTVASPLEQQINGVESMIYMDSSSSSDGSMTITITFEIGTDPDQAMINVNNRVQLALSQLPEEVRRQGVSVQKSSTNVVMIVSVKADERHDPLDVDNYVDLNVIDEITRTPGVGDVMRFGERPYSMRIWMDPNKMTQLGLSPADIAAAISEQNIQPSLGAVGQMPSPDSTQLTYTLTSRGRLNEVHEFENIIIRANPDGSSLRLKDVARVELGAERYSTEGRLNGNESTTFAIFAQPGANVVLLANNLVDVMEGIGARFPDGMTYQIVLDTTKFVRVSIQEVVRTLLEAFVLVFIVVFVFLHNWRATVIPLLAVPVSLIATFAGLYLFGFSINTLTLFAMVLSIGIVVDDAIVVLENVERILETEGGTVRDAAFKAMTEVTGPIIATLLVLVAVFLPVSFLGGLSGQLYKQFAVTIAFSTAVSSVVALSLTPALCVMMLKPKHEAHQKNRFFQAFDRVFDRFTNFFVAIVSFMLKNALLMTAVFLVVVGATGYLFKVVPGGLVPEEDLGYAMGVAILPDSTSLNRTIDFNQKIVKEILKNEAVADIASFSGYNLFAGGVTSSAASFWVSLKDWDERQTPDTQVNAVIGDAFMRTAQFTEGITMLFNPPPIMGMGSSGGLEFYLQSRGAGGAQELGQMSQLLIGKLTETKQFQSVSTQYRPTTPQLFIEIDREKARAMNVSVADAYRALQSTYGEQYVNDFNKLGRIYKVIIQADAQYRATPEGLGDIYVRSQTGSMVPMSALLATEYRTAPQIVQRFNSFESALIMATANPDLGMTDAMEIVEKAATEVLPREYTVAWVGSAYQQGQASNASLLAITFGVIMIFLILAAQYENWSLPLTVLMTVPFAVFGALLGTVARGLTNDVYFQVGIITLIGLAAKNAILIVEFAEINRKAGKSTFDAAVEAARLRLRPILMTSFAFVLGVFPLVISTGAGAASRRALGTGVFSGMLMATVVGVLFIPLFYKVIMDRGFAIRENKNTMETGAYKL